MLETKKEAILVLPCGTEILVDLEDLHRLQERSWYLTKRHDCRPRVVSSIRVYGKPRHLRLEQFILPPPPGYSVFRRPGDPFDYRKSNLLIGTHRDRMRSLGKSSCLKSSKYRGVSKCKTGWRAAIEVNAVSKFIGVFKCEIEAAKAYDHAAQLYFGQFAYRNLKS